MPVQKITKDEILQKSIDVFRTKGYYNTSMQDLAKACGLMKGSFYYYFDSKEILMKELLTSVHNYLKIKVLTIAYDETLSPEERLETMLKKLGKVLLEKEGGCIIGNTTLETAGRVAEFQPILKGIIGDWISATQHIFSAKKSPEMALRLAQQTVIEFEGAVMMVKLFGDKTLLGDCFVRAMVRLN